MAVLSLPATEASARSMGGKSGLKQTQVKKKATQKSHRKKAQKSHRKRVRKPSNNVQAKAAYCIDLTAKKAIVSRNADKPLPVASLTKLVTALVVLDHMSLRTMVTVPEYVRKIPKSVVGLKPGDRLSVNDVLHGLLISSGNDCAEVLAHAFPGGRCAFVRAMNRKVQQLGAKHTVFYNPSGLDVKVRKSSKDPECVSVHSNVSSAKEMAIIARTAFSNKIIRRICTTKSYVMKSSSRKQGYRVHTTNKLLRDHLPVIGGKTGFTARAGHCLASAFTPGHKALIIVVLGSPDHFQDTRLIYRKALQRMGKSRVGDSRVRKQAQLALRQHE
jgi:D-alanyl-D-alanine carboxypeptidase